MLILLALVFCLVVYSDSYSWIYLLLSFINFGKILSISLQIFLLALLLDFVTFTWIFDVFCSSGLLLFFIVSALFQSG